MHAHISRRTPDCRLSNASTPPIADSARPTGRPWLATRPASQSPSPTRAQRSVATDCSRRSAMRWRTVAPAPGDCSATIPIGGYPRHSPGAVAAASRKQGGPHRGTRPEIRHQQVGGSTCSIRRRLRIPCGSLAAEAALRRLCPVAPAVHEAPADAVAGLVGVDTAAATVLGGVSTAGGGGDLRDRLVEGSRGVFGSEPPGPALSGRIAPPNLPAAAVMTDAQCGGFRPSTSIVLSNGRTKWTYLSRDNGHSHRRTDAGSSSRAKKKPRCAGLSQCAREDSNFHGPYGPQGPQPCASTNSATGAGGGQYSPEWGPKPCRGAVEIGRSEPSARAISLRCLFSVHRPR